MMFIFRYFVSAPVIALCLAVVFASVFLILELQQFVDLLIKEQNYPGFIKFAPKILLAVAIPSLDGIYQKIAIWLNDQGN